MGRRLHLLHKSSNNSHEDCSRSSCSRKGCQGGWQEMRQWRQKVQKETEEKEEQKEREKRRQKEVWKRKETETEERKENWKAVESKKERKESKKAKFNEEAGRGKIFIWRTYEWKKHNGGHMFCGPGCKDEEVQQGPSRVQALQESPDLGKADEEQEEQLSFHVR